jgi:hypothetical protein
MFSACVAEWAIPPEWQGNTDFAHLAQVFLPLKMTLMIDSKASLKCIRMPRRHGTW